MENHKQITKISKIDIQFYFQEIPILIRRVDNTTIKRREVFFTTCLYVALLPYFATLHSLFWENILVCFSYSRNLLFPTFFQKLLKNQDTPLSIAQKLFLFISRYLFRKIFWKVCYQLMGLWIVSQNQPGACRLIVKKIFMVSVGKNMNFLFRMSSMHGQIDYHVLYGHSFFGKEMPFGF